jgi:tetratricopeptide (TPR) repeat protein
MSKSQPLPADRHRQANAMLAACDYQVWQTVGAWLDLRGDDVLYVEGAEDFDITGAEQGEAVQVKASDNPISLGQKGTQEALNNFWRLKQAAVVLVSYRFLTRAPFTAERGEPFGPGVAGLELWDRSVLADAQVQSIANFLREQQHVSAELRTWLQNAAASDIRSELIDCVIWQTQSPDIEFVERSIHGKLTSFGETRGYVPPARTIKQIAQALHAEVWKTLRKAAPRSLDRFRLVELWDEKTRISVPQTEVDMRVLQSASAPSPAVTPELLQRGLPPLPGVVAARKELVETLRGLLASTGLLNFHGSTRTGKTTLAKLVAAADPERWSWWSAARRTPREVQRDLRLVLSEVIRHSEIASVILDDIDFSPTTLARVEETLGELVAIIRARRGRVLITSQKPLPPRLRHAFNASSSQVLEIPRLNPGEIEELALNLGCPNDDRKTLWSRFVHATTGGHPQLSAVYLFSLRDRGWPELDVTTIGLAREAIDAERADARQLLGELTDEQQTMVLRLSVFPHAFRRDHAVGFAAESPPLTYPGNLFDSLVGPWIEPLHAGYFAVSPLINDCARGVLSPSDFQKLQNAAAEVLVRTEPRTTTEGAMAFALIWQTKDEGRLVALTHNWMGMEDRLFAALASELLWFAYVATEPGLTLFPENKTISLALRPLQFRVALNTAPDRAAPIVAAWLAECPPIDSGGDALSRLMLAGYVLPYSQVPLPPKLVVDLLKDAAVTLHEYPDLPVPTVTEASFPELDYFPGGNDFVGTLSFFCSYRCISIDFLDGFLSELKSIDPELRERILQGFIGGGTAGRLAIDRAWLAESDKAAPDWIRCLDVFEHAFSLACVWSMPELAIAALRGIAVVLEEYVGDHDAALAAIARLAAQGGLDSHLINDRRASVYFSQGNYAAAEEEWRLALDRWPKGPSFDHGAAFAARSAGISAARQRKWQAAAKWFSKIPNRLAEDGTSFIAGAYADAGFAWWKAGHSDKAIDALIEAWRRADTLPLGKEDLRAFHTRKVVSHVIAWLHQVVGGAGGDLTEPQPGMCSTAELPEKIRELPESEPGAVWLFLIRLERELNAGTRAAGLGAKQVQSTTNPSVRAMASVELIAESLANGNVSDLPKQLIEVVAAMQKAAHELGVTDLPTVTKLPAGGFGGNDPAIGTPAFLAGMISAVSHGKSVKETIQAWRSSVAGVSHAPEWEEWMSQLERGLSAPLGEAAAHARDHKGSWSQACLAR